MAVVLSIDPGSNNGVAKFEDGKLVELADMTPVQLITFLVAKISSISLVIIEDSRMQSYMFTVSKKTKPVPLPVALNMARKVGQVDRLCSMIEAICIDSKTPLITISPKQKGAKVKAKEFKQITGWEGRPSEHMRDAAMVGWNYRRGVKVAA